MREYTEETLTQAVLDRVRHSPNPRTRQMLESLVRHLHGFISELRPTEAEWAAAIDFLTRTGHMCTDRRQEFILLSDTLGASMLVDLINNRADGPVTETTVLGPFYVENAVKVPNGGDISGEMAGEPLFVEGTVRGPDGAPLAGATVDAWQSDSEGFYDLQTADPDVFYLRGQFRTDEQGRFWFWTIMPSSYPIPTDGPAGEMLAAAGRHPYRPAHIHFMVQAPGHRRIVTHLFVRGDTYLESDVVFGVKDSLVADFLPRDGGTAPDGTPIDRPHRHLRHEFTLPAAEVGTKAAA